MAVDTSGAEPPYPLLVDMHGGPHSAVLVVRVGQAEELFAHLIRYTDAPTELVVYPDSSHAEAESGRPSNRVDYHSRLAAWACRWAG